MTKKKIFSPAHARGTRAIRSFARARTLTKPALPIFLALAAFETMSRGLSLVIEIDGNGPG